MKQLDQSRQLIFVGDNHGNWNELMYKISSKKISNAYVISVGDLGIGFNPSRDMIMCDSLNQHFRTNDINFYGIRGNHDDPSYFEGNNRVQLNNFELIEDYSIFQYGQKLIQFIGGAVSIDRTGRQAGTSYWENEGVDFVKEKCAQVDVLVTHTAPSFCFPQTFSEIVYGWAREDAYLLEDLLDERAVMDEIFKLCAPSLHVYGHFHSSWIEHINKCSHKLLGIDEIWKEDISSNE